jgi:methyl-accepting chemotaxis protein
MTTFKDFQIGTKLGLGFGSVLVLLTLVAGAAYMGLTRASDGLNEYRRQTKNLLLTDEIQVDALMTRVNVKDYLHTESAESLKQVQHYLAETAKNLQDAQSVIKNPERAALIATLVEQTRSYMSHFDQFVALVRQRNDLADNRLVPAGNAARKASTELMQANYDGGNNKALLTASRLTEQLMATRLNAGRYLEGGKRQYFDQAMAEMNKADQLKNELSAALKAKDTRSQALLNQFSQAHDQYAGHLKELNRLTEQRQALTSQINVLDAGMAKASATIDEIYLVSHDNLGSQMEANNQETIEFTGGFSTVAIALGLFLAWLLSRIITRPIRAAIVVAEQIAGGNLKANIQVNSRDEVGQLLQTMQTMSAELRRIVGKVSGSSAMVSSTASEISQGSADLAQRTEQQASALEETASSMEQLTATVQQTAGNVAQASQLADIARTQVEQGSVAMQRTIIAMQSIHSSSTKIADIIGVIDEIAFQTNLLALNAAVEAARAGEQGRGFAVVAEEVRRLAQKSSDAAKQIKNLIEDSVNQVEEGSQLADASGNTLNDILLGVKKVNDIVAEIAVASREQASGIEQVNKAILQMDQTTQKNAALVEETAAASQSMGEQASQLHALMSFFKLDSHAHVAVAATPASAVAVRRSQARLPTRPQRSSRPTANKSSTATAFRPSGSRPVAVGNNGGEWEEF